MCAAGYFSKVDVLQVPWSRVCHINTSMSYQYEYVISIRTHVFTSSFVGILLSKQSLVPLLQWYILLFIKSDPLVVILIVGVVPKFYTIVPKLIRVDQAMSYVPVSYHRKVIHGIPKYL